MKLINLINKPLLIAIGGLFIFLLVVLFERETISINNENFALISLNEQLKNNYSNACFAIESLAVAGGFQLFTDAIRARVLPDKRVVDRLARMPIPEDRRLALVGDADGGNLRGADARFVQCSPDHLLGALPDFGGVVFHPTAARKYLFVLPLVRCHHRTGVIEEHTAGAGCTGVYGSDVLRH